VVRAFGQGPPISAPLGVKIFGPDLVLLNQLGEQVRLIMSQSPGVTQSIASITKGEPELVFRTDRDISRFTDLNLSDIALQLQIALEGRLGGSILEDTEEIPIRIRLSEELRSNLVQIDTLPLTRPGDSSDLPLSALGKFELVPRLAGITRINGERVNKVEAFLLPSMPAVDASNMLQKLMAQNQFDLPQGYRIQLAGDADEQQEALGLLAVYAPVLLVMMIATLILSFSSVRLTGVIISVAMLSVGLGMLSLWISGLPIGFNPLLGSAGLIGVAINGSIVVIAAINGNPLARMGDIDQIVIETMGCSRHILSTTFTTVGGFIPLLLFSEGTFWPPLAVVLAGGVGFSVILSLVFTPVVIRQLVKRKQQQSVQQQIA
jgi:multidrug efflux pump subunit AcrB